MIDRPSRTAEVVCFFRAREHTRTDGILRDPFAISFLDPPLRALLATPAAGLFLPQLAAYIAARHRHIDEALGRALAGPVEQVVLLGAGYDSRGWRFAEALAERPVFELDHAATQGRKLRRLPTDVPTSDIRRVPIDFRTERIDEVLAAAGFREGRPTFFVWEGVSMYLRREAVRGTLSTLARLGGPGSFLAMDYWFLTDDPGVFATGRRSAANVLSLVGEPITFALHPDDAADWMRGVGWSVSDVADAESLRRRYLGERRPWPDNYVVVAER